MNFMSYMVSFIKSLFYDKLSQEEASKFHIEGEASLKRRNMYLEERNNEIKQLLWTTENFLFSTTP